MIHSSSVIRRLLIAILSLRGLLVLIWLLRAMVCIVSHISASKTPIGSTRCTALHRSVVGVPEMEPDCPIAAEYASSSSVVDIVNVDHGSTD